MVRSRGLLRPIETETDWFFFAGALSNPEVLRHLLRGVVNFHDDPPKYRLATLNNFKTKFHGPLEEICKLGEDDCCEEDGALIEKYHVKGVA
jgi:hypothetical protein